jgi:hypothetical protein
VVEVAAGIQECPLHEIGGIDAPLKPKTDLRTGPQGKVGPIQLERFAQRLSPPAAGVRQELFAIESAPGAHAVPPNRQPCFRHEFYARAGK